ncbi:hypothetical protein F4778DRAFT_407147 [Xylariomycetidae sp. FL2044]|nr:hypothetical protein F4778DRAFT_407147 [Xylariomycetidae sp. FL2044]
MHITIQAVHPKRIYAFLFCLVSSLYRVWRSASYPPCLCTRIRPTAVHHTLAMKRFTKMTRRFMIQSCSCLEQIDRAGRLKPAIRNFNFYSSLRCRTHRGCTLIKLWFLRFSKTDCLFFPCDKQSTTSRPLFDDFRPFRLFMMF